MHRPHTYVVIRAQRVMQDELPQARVLYCSATGASEAHHLGYMKRLGLWGTGTPFKTFNDLMGETPDAQNV
jgi:hypothetical protein